MRLQIRRWKRERRAELLLDAEARKNNPPNDPKLVHRWAGDTI
ncbi:MAG: hypothetical protein M5R36_25625 [Deltaproteobacteria bacterium]|nr:hypothetical protein [Deltaproteobacteria bacterium]